MNNISRNNIIRFVLLVLAQAAIFSHVNFLGYINPYPYILFIILYPITNNRMVFLTLSFLLGLTVDMFSDSGGINAAACVTLAFVRPAVLKFCFGSLYEHQSVKFNNIDITQRFIYFSIMVFIHHLMLFLLEIFNVTNILLIVEKTLSSSIFTIILCLLFSIIFSRNTK